MASGFELIRRFFDRPVQGGARTLLGVGDDAALLVITSYSIHYTKLYDECKRPTLKRLVSAPAFLLKGSGWYETDFKKDNKRNLADSSGIDTSGKVSSGGGGKSSA